MDDLQNILKFTKLINKFQQVRRHYHANGEDRMENDVEHSYELAMLAWYIISIKKINLNLDLVIKYALVHDLVEVYAGDTYAHTTDTELKENKIEREETALKKLRGEFTEFPEIFGLIEEYNRKENLESKFVYALDKIEPIFDIYTNNGRTWKERKITIDMIVDIKKDKVKLDPEIERLFYEILKVLRKEEEDIFN